jgi:ABC-type Fe3+-hydroxamate transport system substrate-binding protein
LRSCAAGGKLVKAALDGMSPDVAHPRFVELTARSLEGLYADVKAVAAACGVPARGVELVTNLKTRVAAVAAAVGAAGDGSSSSAPSLERPVRVVCLEWLDPLYNAG